MKKRKSNAQNGHNSAQDLIAEASRTEKIAEAARKHLKMLKAEHKQARKAFKQAKKAAKRARKEVKAAAKLLKSRNGNGKPHRSTKPAKRSSVSTAKVPSSIGRTSSPTLAIAASPAASDVLVAKA